MAVDLTPGAQQRAFLTGVRLKVLHQMARPTGLRMAMQELLLDGANRLHDHGYEAWGHGHSVYGQLLIDIAHRMEQEASHA